MYDKYMTYTHINICISTYINHVHEVILNITSHQGNTIEKNNDISAHYSKNKYCQEA